MLERRLRRAETYESLFIAYSRAFFFFSAYVDIASVSGFFFALSE